MKLNYKLTLDEAVEADVVMTELGDTYWRQYRLQIFNKVIEYAAIVLFAYLGLGVSWAIVIALLFLVTTILMLVQRGKRLRAAYRQFKLEQWGSSNARDIEWEMDDDGVAVRLPGYETRWTWEILEAVDEDDTFVMLRFKGVGATLIPKQAFESTEQQAEWMHMARDRMGFT